MTALQTFLQSLLFPGHFHFKSNHADFQNSTLFPLMCGINFAVNLIFPNTKYT